MGRHNLRVETGCLAQRVEIEGRRARGVSWRQGDMVRRANASREVVLTAGAIGTPHLMMASGIGPAAHLVEHGIRPALDLPGVGANLIDHLQVRLIHRIAGARTLNTIYHSVAGRVGMLAQYVLLRRGPLTMAPAQLGLFARSDPGRTRANVQFHVQALSFDRWGAPLHDFPAFTTSVCNAHPTSRGSVRLAGPDIATPPRIKPNYLATEEDRRVLVDAVRLARRIVGQKALARFEPKEILPGEPDGGSDAGLLKAAGDIAATIFHPVGTARMGPAGDPLAVVDARLRVNGVAGLRIADASIMPGITSGNTAGPTMMIAEKAAAMIREDARH
jgi:choline dehydrogenase-like flavoprotein